MPPVLDYILEQISAIIPGFGYDHVVILDNTSFTLRFPFAAIRAVEPTQPIRLMQHPIESGAVITDHYIVEPVSLTIQMIYPTDFRSQFESTYAAARQGALFTVQTRGSVYQNLTIANVNHREAPEHIDALMANVQFREVQIVQPEYGALPQGKVASSKDASTQPRGTQNPVQSSRAREIIGRVKGN